jgi:hypothetical protein
LAEAAPAVGDAAVAQKALREVSRLVGEATRRFEQDAFIEAMSSLTAIPSVLDPLIGFLGYRWVTEVGLTEEVADDQQAGGMYL